MAVVSDQLRNIVVIGAGVVGLTTALKIQEKGGYRVTIIAEALPNDPKSIKYTSNWAGAHHVSSAGDDTWQQNMDQETFRKMWELSAPGGAAEGCFLRISQTEFHSTEISKPHPLHVMPDFECLDKGALHPGCVSGITFSTVTIDPPTYLNYILSRFLAKGGLIVRGTVQHINEVIEGGARIFSRAKNLSPSVDAVVVCAGLGARTLGGVEDKAMYPVRGQTVLLHAPWIRFGRTLNDANKWAYIIPRRNGDVILGGTRDSDDWFSCPRPKTTLDILQNSLNICPELAPPEIRAVRDPKVEDLLPIIIEEGCGLRPARKGGIRLELEWFDAIKTNGQVPIVHNYGHGGYGFQSSWGSASKALELLESAFI